MTIQKWQGARVRCSYEKPETEWLTIRFEGSILSNGQNTQVLDPEEGEIDL